MGEDDHVLDRNAMSLGNVADKGVNVIDDDREILGGAAFAGRLAVAAGVPCEDGEVVEFQQLDDFLPASGMLVAAVKEEERFVGGFGGSPGAIAELGAVVGREGVFGQLHEIVTCALTGAISSDGGE